MLVNVGERSASFFRCFPVKITKITLAFGVIINKTLSKSLPTTQQGYSQVNIRRKRVKPPKNCNTGKLASD